MEKKQEPGVCHKCGGPTPGKGYDLCKADHIEWLKAQGGYTPSRKRQSGPTPRSAAKVEAEVPKIVGFGLRGFPAKADWAKPADQVYDTLIHAWTWVGEWSEVPEDIQAMKIDAVCKEIFDLAQSGLVDKAQAERYLQLSLRMMQQWKIFEDKRVTFLKVA